MPAPILIVEDDENEVLLLKRALKQAGVDVPTNVVVDGRAAIDFLDDAHRRDDWRPPRLVLLDLNLPRVSGLEVLRWARQHPLLRRLPIVVLTSSDEPSDIAEAYDLGANSYVVKPRRVADLDDVVRRFREYWLELNASPPLPSPPRT